MSHISATARLGFAYTRSAGGASYADMRDLFVASGMFDISTPFSSSPLYAEDPKMVDDPRLLALNTPWDEKILRTKLASAQGKAAEVTRDTLRKEMETLVSIVR